MLEGYYYTFKKLKKNWSWPTSVGPAPPSKSKRKFHAKFCPPPRLLQWGSSKLYNFFSIGSLLSLEKFSFCLFSEKKLEFVCFPPFLPAFFKKVGLFLPKIAYIDGKQTNQNIFLNDRFKCLKCFYIPWLYQKLQIGTNYDCSNTRRWWEKWRNFRIFSKKQLFTLNYCFFWKNTKISPFPPSSACIWTIIICSNLKLLVQPGYVEAFQTVKPVI